MQCGDMRSRRPEGPSTPSVASLCLTCVWRRGRDSNPRWAFDPRPLSKRVPSATRSPLPVDGGRKLPVPPGSSRQLAGTRFPSNRRTRSGPLRTWFGAPIGWDLETRTAPDPNQPRLPVCTRSQLGLTPWCPWRSLASWRFSPAVQSHEAVSEAETPRATRPQCSLRT